MPETHTNHLLNHLQPVKLMKEQEVSKTEHGVSIAIFSPVLRCERLDPVRYTNWCMTAPIMHF